MNIRSLTRGDGVVIGAAVLLFIASFLNLYSYSASGFSESQSVWDNLGTGLGTYMGAVIGAALIVLNRCMPQQRKVLGLDLGMVGTGFTVLAAWTLFWTLVDVPDHIDAGAGLVLGFIAALVLAAAAIATPLVPPLQGALIPAPKPVAPQPYGAQPPAGYGYPGAQQQPYGAQPQQQGQPFGQPQPAAAQAAAPQPAPADFSPFWFAVPVTRPLFAEDGSPTPVAELAPGTWYLAVEQRGAALVAQTQDGRRGVLQDTSGIQRG
ncbi:MULTISPECIES: DUF5336 domain-containing protein [Streptomyces]|uniref:DUF5336 domain-containing protein n=1 Tax=Streptomyces TaxID=1883 RepID=UPI0008691BF1|nr:MULTISPECIES: DUF5336 domain-containing protein [Streptomyces]SFY50144.1 hypothetical protein STEPF1_03390 [Streptomyces sp. F-1]